jgi:hypothetical protein
MVIGLQIPTTFWTVRWTTLLLNVYRVSNVRQIEICTNPGPYEVKITITKLEKYTSPGSDQIPAEVIQAGTEILHYKIRKLINSFWNKKNCLIS